MQASEKTKVRRSEKYKSKVPYWRSPYAENFEDRSQEEIERQERCARGDAWKIIGQEHLTAQRNGQSYLLLTHQRMVSRSAIRDKTRGKRTCCRFWREYPHVEQKRPELRRIGNCEGL